MGLKQFVQHTARRLGYDIWYFDRMRLLKNFGINLIFDVGANIGQYGKEMRSLGYRGKIISFEPLSAEFKLLSKHANGDYLWQADNRALGERDGTAEIHVSRNSQSSSLLEMLPRHLQAAPTSRYEREELIQVARLDTVFRQYWKEGDRVLLKLDTQGYDYQVLSGGMTSLPFIMGIQIELSLVPLYEGTRKYEEILGYLSSLGFTLMSIETVFRDRTFGQMLQVDGILYRDKTRL